MDPLLLARQLEVLEGQLSMLQAQIRSLRLAMKGEPPPPEEVDGQCMHPPSYRQAAPSMGQPEREYCNRCRAFIGGKS